MSMKFDNFPNHPIINTYSFVRIFSFASLFHLRIPCYTLGLPGVPCRKTSAAIAPVTSPAPTTAAPTPVQTDLRLPGTIVPYHYNLRLRPDIYTGNTSTFRFDGRVEMFFRVSNATDLIVLLARNLTVDTSSIKVTSTDVVGSIGVVDVMYDTESEFLNISLVRSLDVGRQYVVSLSFTGPITDGLKGLYYSSYKLGGETR